jgi:hypothetical protein
MLRDPVARAVSSFWFKKVRGADTRTFETAMRDGMRYRRNMEACQAAVAANHPSAVAGAEGEAASAAFDRLQPFAQREVLDECFFNRTETVDPESQGGLFSAHVDKGVYVDQLKRWFGLFDTKQFFVYSLEEYMADEVGTYQRQCDFLGLEAVGERGFRSAEELKMVLAHKYNTNTEKGPMDPAVLDELAEFYAPYTKELFGLVGRDLW